MFSFHPRKSITTGEGGMITTADTALADRMRFCAIMARRCRSGSAISAPDLTFFRI